MPRHRGYGGGGYGAMNRAAGDAMMGMYDGMEEGNPWLSGGYGAPETASGAATNYDTLGSVSPESLGGDMNIGPSGSDNPVDGAGMAGMYTPDYPQEGGMGEDDGARNRRAPQRPGNPYLRNQ